MSFEFLGIDNALRAIWHVEKPDGGDSKATVPRVGFVCSKVNKLDAP